MSVNARALPLVVIELLRGFIDDIKDYNEFDLFLRRMSEESVLSEHWMKNLVQPVLLRLLYIRAESEGVIHCFHMPVKKRFHIFLLLVTKNYERDSLCYFRSMETFSGNIIKTCFEISKGVMG